VDNCVPTIHEASNEIVRKGAGAIRTIRPENEAPQAIWEKVKKCLIPGVALAARGVED